MARPSKSAWLLAGAVIIASCGGGDDTTDGGGNDGNNSADDIGATLDTAAPDDAAAGESGGGEPADPDAATNSSDGGDETTAAASTDSALGPALEPVATFAVPVSASPLLQGLAVSPTGERVVVKWTDESDLTPHMGVFDAATGAELASTTDDRIKGDVFWTADDRLITVGSFGEVWEWDVATLTAVDTPIAPGEPGCASGNGTVFDPVAGALFLKSDSLCRIDVTTGEVVQSVADNPTTLLAVAIGGGEVYLRGTDAASELVLRVLDSATLAVISDEAADGPNPVVAASANGTIAQTSGGFDYAVQPSGRVVDFYPNGITTSATGSYYVGGYDGGIVVVSSSDGTTVGTIDSTSGALTSWSGDDRILVTRTAESVSVFNIG